MTGHHSQVLRKCAGLVCAVFLGVLFAVPFQHSVGAESLGEEWEAITADQSKLVLAIPALNKARARYIRTEAADYSYRIEAIIWSDSAFEHARALLGYKTLAPLYHFRNRVDPEDIIKARGFYREAEVDIGPFQSGVNEMGSFWYREFTLNDVPCIAFTQSLGLSGFLGTANEILFGYYCSEENSLHDAHDLRTVKDSLGIKGVYIPPHYEQRLAAEGNSSPLASAVTGPVQLPVVATLIPTDNSKAKTDELLGKLWIDRNGKAGTLVVDFPEPYGSCRGRWFYDPVRGSGEENKPGGWWYLSCLNGKGAEGDYELQGELQGVGSGTLGQDYRIEFAYGVNLEDEGNAIEESNSSSNHSSASVERGVRNYLDSQRPKFIAELSRYNKRHELLVVRSTWANHDTDVSGIESVDVIGTNGQVAQLDVTFHVGDKYRKTQRAILVARWNGRFLEIVDHEGR